MGRGQERTGSKDPAVLLSNQACAVSPSEFEINSESYKS